MTLARPAPAQAAGARPHSVGGYFKIVTGLTSFVYGVSAWT